MRSWVDEDPQRDDEERGGEFTIASGKVIVVWSPVAPFDLDGIKSPEALLALGGDGPAKLHTPGIRGIGTVVTIKPGRYAVTQSSYETPDDVDPSWSCRWCRLKRVG